MEWESFVDYLCSLCNIFYKLDVKISKKLLENERVQHQLKNFVGDDKISTIYLCKKIEEANRIICLYTKVFCAVDCNFENSCRVHFYFRNAIGQYGSACNNQEESCFFF